MRQLGPIFIGALLAGCEMVSEPHPTVISAPEALFARGDGFPIVQLRSSGSAQPGEAGAPLARTLEEALDRVAPGGTIRVHPGEYAAQSVLIDKPVTIEAAARGAKPVIRTVTGLEGLLVKHPTGTVTIRGLEFRNDVTHPPGIRAAFTYSIRAFDSFANLLVEDSDFLMATGGHASGIFAASGGVPDNSRLVVRRSTFNGGRAAIAAVGGFSGLAPSAIEIHDNHFQGHRANNAIQSNFSVQLIAPEVVLSGNIFTDCGDRCVNIGGDDFKVVDNVISDCGVFHCVHAFSGTGVIARNRITNAVGRTVRWGIRASGAESIRIEKNEVTASGDGDAFDAGIEVSGPTRATVVDNRVGGATRGIQFWGVPVGEIARNLVDPCGAWNCIGVEGGGQNVTVTANTLRGVLERRTLFAIQGAWPAGSGSLVITDNEIEGVGAPSNPNDPRTYPLQIAFQNTAWWPPGVEGVARGESVEFSRNRISNAEVGVRAFHGGVIEGRDNTLTTVFGELFGAHDRGINRLRFNNVNDYARALAISGSPVADAPHHGTLEVTCNYWGGGPPQGTETAPVSAYTPWAASPIANTAASSCNGET